MKKVVVIADLGHFRAYRFSKTFMGTGRLDLIDSFDSAEAHVKISDTVSDKAGNFGGSVGKNAASKGSGEAHNMVIENEKRIIKKIADSINKIVMEQKCETWDMAAVKAINGQILESIEPKVKLKLGMNIAADLTKAEKSDILKRLAD